MSDPRRPVLFGQPLLPQRAAFDRLMDEVFANRWLTNGGALHDRFEGALGRMLGGDAVLVSSGTMALMMALRLGDLPAGGEVITSPLSFAASVQAIDWCGLRPVFADVEPGSPTICAAAVEKAITPRTVAILAVHFLGLACDVAALEEVARRHGLWLVFDAAQAPDVTLGGRSIALSGDATALSLHATKLLNTAEGGAVLAPVPGGADRLRRMRNFGLEAGRMVAPGTNAKLSEVHAAFGLAMLPDLPREVASRQALRAGYQAALRGLPGVEMLQPRPGSSASHLYCTLSLDPALCDRARRALEEAGIRARPPFALLCGPGTAFPDAPVVSTAAQAVAPQVSARYLSLPLHGEVTAEAVGRIAEVMGRIVQGEQGAGNRSV